MSDENNLNDVKPNEDHAEQQTNEMTDSELDNVAGGGGGLWSGRTDSSKSTPSVSEIVVTKSTDTSSSTLY